MFGLLSPQPRENLEFLFEDVYIFPKYYISQSIKLIHPLEAEIFLLFFRGLRFGPGYVFDACGGFGKMNCGVNSCLTWRYFEKTSSFFLSHTTEKECSLSSLHCCAAVNNENAQYVGEIKAFVSFLYNQNTFLLKSLFQPKANPSLTNIKEFSFPFFPVHL